MPETKRTAELHRCPGCKRNVRPNVLEDVPARPNAHPPIPARQRVRCPAKGCDMFWYVILGYDAD